jgi:hypothetical protein
VISNLVGEGMRRARAGSVMIMDPASLMRLVAAGEQLRVEDVDPRTIRTNPLHPPIHHDERYLSGLKEIRRDGISSTLPVVEVDGGLLLIDGHRRVATAVEVGIKTVRVLILTPEQLRAVWAAYPEANRERMRQLPHLAYLIKLIESRRRTRRPRQSLAGLERLERNPLDDPERPFVRNDRGVFILGEAEPRSSESGSKTRIDPRIRARATTKKAASR